VAIRIVELARAGEFDPDKLTETVLAEFDGSGDGGATVLIFLGVFSRGATAASVAAVVPSR
jgi:hypothetical protein